MAIDREVRVKLVADVTEFNAALDAAKAKLGEFLALVAKLPVPTVRVESVTESDPIGAHGFPLSVATDSANQYAFECDPFPTVDFAAEAISKAKALYYKAWPDADPAGRTWPVRLNPQAPGECRVKAHSDETFACPGCGFTA